MRLTRAGFWRIAAIVVAIGMPGPVRVARTPYDEASAAARTRPRPTSPFSASSYIKQQRHD